MACFRPAQFQDNRIHHILILILVEFLMDLIILSSASYFCFKILCKHLMLQYFAHIKAYLA
jgi:hypothetical protein